MGFSKILIANRGEIACRVIKTAQAMGYETVAVYSDADKAARHVHLADQAVHIGPASVTDSYLNIERIIEACNRSGADAVHPGYGFLSENAAFAEACKQAEITFIGPPVNAIELMGSKRQSKIAMQSAGVPCIPGYEGDDQSDDTLLKEAQRIGLPLMIKASAGGGGRGMRIVNQFDELTAQLRSARSEAKNAFGSEELILERAILNPRHIEIQVFGDQYGNVIHLGERDCSVQRRHQKVVEEAPSPAVSPALREKMGQAAVLAAKSCDYTGAGTVEFLLTETGDFFFLEMNTRLQVEHPVTELITGLDLVEWQLRVAQGEKLPYTQEQVTLTGHAIEVRLYAEDTQANFTPQTGSVLHWQPAELPGIRIDHGVLPGCDISSHYDPMLAKLIAFGRTRDDALRRLLRAIRHTHLLGVTTNRAFLHNILAHPVFTAGHATTAFITQDFEHDTSLVAPEGVPVEVLLMAALRITHQQPSHPHWQGWRSSGTGQTPVLLRHAEQLYPVQFEQEGGHLTVRHQAQQCTGQLIEATDTSLLVEINGIRQRVACTHHDGHLYIDWQLGHWVLEDITHAPVASKDQAGSGLLRAPMDASVAEVLCQPGEQVTKGQPLMLLEAMKIEHSICADTDGTLVEVNAAAGDQVKTRQILARIQPAQGEQGQ